MYVTFVIYSRLTRVEYLKQIVGCFITLFKHIILFFFFFISCCLLLLMLMFLSLCGKNNFKYSYIYIIFIILIYSLHSAVKLLAIYNYILYIFHKI